MQTPSLRKWSVLGLVLMTASAVTAAVVPSKDKTTYDLNGNCKLIDTDNTPATCTAPRTGANPSCDRTGAGQGATNSLATASPTVNTTATNGGEEGTGC